MSMGGKENDLIGSNILRKPNAGFGPPPKASLMTMSSAYDVPMETLGGDKADGSKKVSRNFLLNFLQTHTIHCRDEYVYEYAHHLLPFSYRLASFLTLYNNL